MAQVADRVALMYAGQIVEQASVMELFRTPPHPCTRGLLRSTPRLAGAALRASQQPGDNATPQHLPVIPGDVPHALRRPSGGPFHPRCELGHDDTVGRTQLPPLLPVASEHGCACWKADGYPAVDARARVVGPAETPYNPAHADPRS